MLIYKRHLGSINYDSNDRFTLNGQRLMSISGNEYRYEVEQWSKVVAEGVDLANPDSWTEYLPDGTVRRYGSTSVNNYFICVLSACH
jgi:hypothetical protein